MFPVVPRENDLLRKHTYHQGDAVAEAILVYQVLLKQGNLIEKFDFLYITLTLHCTLQTSDNTLDLDSLN